MTEVENAPTRNPTSDLGLPSCYMTVTTWMWDETDYMDVVDEMKCSCQNSEFLFRLCFFQAGRLAVFWVLVGFVACAKQQQQQQQQEVIVPPPLYLLRLAASALRESMRRWKPHCLPMNDTDDQLPPLFKKASFNLSILLPRVKQFAKEKRNSHPAALVLG